MPNFLSFPPDTRFTAPGETLLTQLINAFYGTSFAVGDLLFDAVLPQVSSDPTLIAPNTRVNLHAAWGVQGCGPAHVLYNRLSLEDYLGPNQSYLPGDETTTEAQVLAHLHDLWNVTLLPTDVTIVGLGEPPDETGAIVIQVIPRADHLVWNAAATLELVDPIHLGLDLTQRIGTGLTVPMVEGVTPTPLQRAAYKLY